MIVMILVIEGEGGTHAKYENSILKSSSQHSKRVVSRIILGRNPQGSRRARKDILLALQKQRAQRRQRQPQRIRTAMNWFGNSVRSAEIANAASTVYAGVAVEQFAPVASIRHADAVAETRYRSEVAHDQNRIFRRLALAQQRNGAGRVVIAVHPLKARRTIVQHVHRRFIAIETVQLLHPVPHAAMDRVLQDIPVQA